MSQPCKTCVKEYEKSRNFSVDPNLKEKTCSKCKETKSVNKFDKNRRKTDGLQSRCRNCFYKYIKQRCETDPLFRLKHNMLAEIHRVTQAVRLKNSNRVFKRLGCTVTEFKEHIESNFVEGMSWDNYGYYTWHIDHIIPLYWFVKNSDNPSEANHYTNLQPMWAEDNMSKKRYIK